MQTLSGPGLWDTMSGWFNKRNAPQIGGNPYQSQWGDLIGQLQQQSSSNYQGPSLAGNAYRQAADDGMRQQMSMARGGSAGAARQAGMNLAGIQQGMASGYSNARLQEQLAARQSLQGALTNAGNAWFQPQQANLQAMTNTQSNGQQLMNFLQQLGMIGGTVGGAGGAGGAGK